MKRYMRALTLAGGLMTLVQGTRSRWLRTAACALPLVAASILALAPANARAGSVHLHIDVGVVEFHAYPGERNKLTVVTYPTVRGIVDECILGIDPPCEPTEGDTMVLNDSGAPITVGCSGECSSQLDVETVLGLHPTCFRWPGELPQSLQRANSRLVGCFAARQLIDLGDGDDALFLKQASEPATVYAGPGNDRLRTVNGVADEVHCGDGNDVVTIADSSDVIDADCESVTTVP